MTNGKYDVLDASELNKIPNRYWKCPVCEVPTLSNNGADWCGKNLRCTCCGTYNYYKDFDIVWERQNEEDV